MEKFQDFARVLSTGAPAPLASVSVKDHGTDTLSTLFSDDGVTPMANPTTADSSGYYRFYAANGRYDVDVTPAAPEFGATPPAYGLADILLYDPED